MVRRNGSADEYDYLNDVIVDEDGSIFVTAEIRETGTGSDLYAARFDPDGTEVWSRMYNGPDNGDDSGFEITLDAAGNIYMAGQSGGPNNQSDCLTIKYDSDGNELWAASYDGGAYGSDFGLGIALDRQQNVYVTGGSTGIGTGWDYTTIKYSQGFPRYKVPALME